MPQERPGLSGDSQTGPLSSARSRSPARRAERVECGGAAAGTRRLLSPVALGRGPGARGGGALRKGKDRHGASSARRALGPPGKPASTGLSAGPPRPRAMAAATSSASVTSGGMKIARTLSTASSSSRICELPVVLGDADAIMSTGLPMPPPRQERAQRRDRSFAERPAVEAVRLARVGAMMPGPPAFVTIADAASARQRLVREQERHVEQLLERVRADDAGLPEQRVDTASARASAPVCDDAARAPAAERPHFTATIGFVGRRGARSG